MSTVPIYQAKAKLSNLIARACAGEVVVISKGNKPAVRLVPVRTASERRFGCMRGKAGTGKEFFEPLPTGELEAWDQ